MKIVKGGPKKWVAISSYDEKDLPKSMGMRWDKNARCWWTNDPMVALKLIEYASDEKVAESIRAASNIVEQTIMASRATDADIDIPAPNGLQYLPFQRAGIAYCLKRQSVLIGDEMGLGKTIQAIGVINADQSIKRVLVVCPATLRLNWKNEIEKWITRDISVGLYDGGEDLLKEGISIINYDKLVGKKGLVSIEKLRQIKFDLLICDEAHFLKNRKAQRTVAILGNKEREGLIKSVDRKLFLTGTPILNRPIELHPLLAAIEPNTFGNFWAFAKRYCDATQGRWGWDLSGASNLGELQEKMRSTCMVRRLKKDVLKELPKKRRQIIEISQNGAQGKIEMEKKRFALHEETMAVTRAQADLARAEGNEELYRLAVDRLRETGRIAFAEISAIRHELAVQKIPRVIECIEDIFEGGTSKLVVFAHHRDVVDGIANHFMGKAVVLTGEQSIEERQSAVDRFQSDQSINLFVGTIKAAGVGITLTAADHVIFAELDWVPANITQAEDRVHRIGQENSVLIQHLVWDGSLDSKMVRTLVEKQDIADRALDIVVEKSEPVLPKIDAVNHPKKYPQVSTEEKARLLQCMRTIAGYCDGAINIDGRGFNKYDTEIGHKLAGLTALTDGQAWLAGKLAQKYRGQLNK